MESCTDTLGSLRPLVSATANFRGAMVSGTFPTSYDAHGGTHCGCTSLCAGRFRYALPVDPSYRPNSSRCQIGTKQLALVAQSLSRPPHIILPGVEEVARRTKFVLMLVPDVLSHIQERCFTTVMTESFANPIFQILARCQRSILQYEVPSGLCSPIGMQKSTCGRCVAQERSAWAASRWPNPSMPELRPSSRCPKCLRSCPHAPAPCPSALRAGSPFGGRRDSQDRMDRVHHAARMVNEALRANRPCSAMLPSLPVSGLGGIFSSPCLEARAPCPNPVPQAQPPPAAPCGRASFRRAHGFPPWHVFS
jgi:hypothetical protein